MDKELEIIPSGSSLDKQFRLALTHLRNNALLLILVSAFLFFSISSEYFATSSNLLLIFMQLAPLGIVVVGQTLVIITGGIDLSIGSVAGLTSIIAAKLMLDSAPIQFPPLFAIAIALTIATMIGWIHGWLIARRRLAPFIVTFGSLSLIKGVALVYSNAAPIPIPNALSQAIWRIGSSSRPMPIILMILIAIAMAYILRSTKLGRYAFAIGSNEAVTRMSGVRVDYYKIQVYMISSFLAGVAGILLMTRIRSGVYTNAEDYALLSVAAAVIGGTSLRGGVGNVHGPLIGALIIVMIDTSLGFFNISALWSMAIIGSFILVAALIDGERQNSDERIPKPHIRTAPAETTYYKQTRAQLAKLILQRTACEYMRLYMVDRQTGDLVEQSLEKDEKIIVHEENHLAKWVEKNRLPFWGDDLNDEDEVTITPIQVDLHSFMAVPILRGDRFIGVLELQSPYEGVFTENTAVLLTSLIQPMTTPLENCIFSFLCP